MKFVMIGSNIAIIAAFLVRSFSNEKSTIPYLWFYIVLLALFMLITKRILASFAATSVLAYSIVRISEIKKEHLEEPLYIQDIIFFARDNGLFLISNYTSNNIKFICYLLAGIALVVVNLTLFNRQSTRAYAQTMAALIIAIAVLTPLTTQQLAAQDEKNLMFRASIESFAHSLFLDHTKLTAYESTYSLLPIKPGNRDVSSSAHCAGEELPDIYFVLQESTYDETQCNAINLFKDSKISGKLRVHTYGGGTWKSEFSALTGVPTGFLGKSANYITYTSTKSFKNSLVKHLKSIGYHSVVISPTGRDLYNSNSFYRAIGFDNFLYYDLIPSTSNPRPGRYSLQRDIDVFNAALAYGDSRPVFYHLINVSTHGGYATNNELGDYCERVGAVQNALYGFIDKLNNNGKPFILVHYGDHRPHFNSKNVHIDDKFTTYYTVVSNIDIDSYQLDVDIADLPCLVYSKINLPKTEYTDDLCVAQASRDRTKLLSLLSATLNIEHNTN